MIPMAFYRARRPALLAAGLALLTFGAACVPATVAAAPPRRVRVTVGRTDYRFLIRASQSSLYEQRAARLAEDRAARSAVRDYARSVARDHDARRSELNRLLLDKGLTPQNSPSAVGKRRLARLDALRGAAFDRTYIREAVRINRADQAAARSAARTTRDRDIQAFLRRFARSDAAQLRGALALRRTGGRSAM